MLQPFRFCTRSLGAVAQPAGSAQCTPEPSFPFQPIPEESYAGNEIVRY